MTILPSLRNSFARSIHNSLGSNIAVSGRSPLDISSCLLLLDYSDWSTLFTDTAGTTPVTAISQSVAAIRDLKNGVLFTQSDAGLRAIVAREPITGVRNRLYRTEQYDNAAWTKNGVTVAVNAAANPLDGATTADRIWPTSANNTKNVLAARNKATVAEQFTLSVYAKADGYNTLILQLDSGADTNSVFASFDLANGISTLPTLAGSYTAASTNMVELASGWYRCSVTVTTGNEGVVRAIHWIDSRAAYVGANFSTTGIFLWGSQLEKGTLSTYQSCIGGEDLTEAGVASRFSIFDTGATIQHYNATVDLSTINNLTCCFGYRATSFSGARQIINQNGVIAQSFGAVMTTGALLQSASRGSGTTATGSVAGAKPQETFVGTTLHSISVPLSQAHYNNVVGTPVTTSQGTGNFTNGQLRILSRTDTGLTAVGNHYSLALFSSILSGDDLAFVKQWMAEKSGVTL